MLGVPMVVIIMDRYDDTCHLLGRAMSLIGTCWMAALICCLAIVTDKFHFLNHTDPWCVGALNPYKYKGVDDGNTQRCVSFSLIVLCVYSLLPCSVSAEQKFQWGNQHSKTVNQMNGGSFRFFLMRASDLRNCVLVTKQRTKRTSDLPQRYHTDLQARHSKHRTALRGNTFTPNLPDAYLDGSISMINVRRFKQRWDLALGTHALVVESKEQREKLPREKKFALRRALCDHLVNEKVVF